MNLTKRFGPGSPLKKIFCENLAKRKKKIFLHGCSYGQIFLSNPQKWEFSTHPKTSTECGKLTVWSSSAPESLQEQPYQTIFLVFRCQHQLIGLWHTLTPKHVVNAKKDNSNRIIECSGACWAMISQFGLVWYGLVWLVYSVKFASEARFPSLFAWFLCIDVAPSKFKSSKSLVTHLRIYPGHRVHLKGIWLLSPCNQPYNCQNAACM